MPDKLTFCFVDSHQRQRAAAGRHLANDRRYTDTPVVRQPVKLIPETVGSPPHRGNIDDGLTELRIKNVQIVDRASDFPELSPNALMPA